MLIVVMKQPLKGVFRVDPMNPLVVVVMSATIKDRHSVLPVYTGVATPSRRGKSKRPT